MLRSVPPIRFHVRLFPFYQYSLVILESQQAKWIQKLPICRPSRECIPLRCKYAFHVVRVMSSFLSDVWPASLNCSFATTTATGFSQTASSRCIPMYPVVQQITIENSLKRDFQILPCCISSCVSHCYCPPYCPVFQLEICLTLNADLICAYNLVLHVPALHHPRAHRGGLAFSPVSLAASTRMKMWTNALSDPPMTSGVSRTVSPAYVADLDFISPKRSAVPPENRIIFREDVAIAKPILDSAPIVPETSWLQ